METKVCSKCGEEKPLKMFYKQARSKDGYRGVCKKCTYGKDSPRSFIRPADEVVEKECITCGEMLPIENFSKISKEKSPYYQASCRKCKNKYKAVKNKMVYTYKRRDLRLKYGITLDEFNKMVNLQDNKCKICGKEFIDNKEPCVDHCHNTGVVRGILCSNCNTGIGLLKEDIEIFKSAISYLENSKKIISQYYIPQL